MNHRKCYETSCNYSRNNRLRITVLSRNHVVHADRFGVLTGAWFC
uniref:Uncharacterized protein n=1 Tax=Podoviridae sp. ctEmK1 TaxID=2827727 RepID=A0A8S5S529_9CAUD|nr:MAG TPA: hypothetical protein [Podoviridae sp. ctEmK1]